MQPLIFFKPDNLDSMFGAAIIYNYLKQDSKEPLLKSFEWFIHDFDFSKFTAVHFCGCMFDKQKMLHINEHCITFLYLRKTVDIIRYTNLVPYIRPMTDFTGSKESEYGIAKGIWGYFYPSEHVPLIVELVAARAANDFEMLKQIHNWFKTYSLIKTTVKTPEDALSYIF